MLLPCRPLLIQSVRDCALAGLLRIVGVATLLRLAWKVARVMVKIANEPARTRIMSLHLALSQEAEVIHLSLHSAQDLKRCTRTRMMQFEVLSFLHEQLACLHFQTGWVFRVRVRKTPRVTQRSLQTDDWTMWWHLSLCTIRRKRGCRRCMSWEMNEIHAVGIIYRPHGSRSFAYSLVQTHAGHFFDSRHAC